MGLFLSKIPRNFTKKYFGFGFDFDFAKIEGLEIINKIAGVKRLPIDNDFEEFAKLREEISRELTKLA